MDSSPNSEYSPSHHQGDKNDKKEREKGIEAMNTNNGHH